MNPLQLYDTLTRERHPVTPSDGQTLRFYCCGPTVYGPAHIGNFRTFLAQDLFRRVVELSGIETLHVRNLTDVDDKTIRQSQAEGKSLHDFTAFWTERFHRDCEALNLLSPHVEPSAVMHLPEQIELIATLVKKGHAYQSADGSVYFRVSSFDRYGKLTRIERRELLAGAGDATNQDADEYDKDSVADFALWKARKPEDGENFWPSPWGDGRPGWHLECSAMCLKYLGDTFDLHSGGVDLCFPHHENEIAQNDAATGGSFARHWFHVEHLMVDGAKMSKSLGNLYTLSDIVSKGFQPGELRFALLSGHYNTKINFTFDRLTEARGNLQRIASLAHALEQKAACPMSQYDEIKTLARTESFPATSFNAAWFALLEDLNAPKAIGEIFSVIKPLEKSLDSLSSQDCGDHLLGLARICHAFGWILPAADSEKNAETPANVADLAARRWQAKQEKNWAEADKLRDELLSLGWVVKDGKDHYEVVKAD